MPTEITFTKDAGVDSLCVCEPAVEIVSELAEAGFAKVTLADGDDTAPRYVNAAHVLLVAQK